MSAEEIKAFIQRVCTLDEAAQREFAAATAATPGLAVLLGALVIVQESRKSAAAKRADEG